ncbi:hypothetical protein ASPWEDRAFT_716852 [Aspergillus wentii DTO 134E9]|uniref:Uncharacterized protein n=1 Tax=Aspergillus wentii DTO 134E9 TaxID=1073089 RepID=A0A1L9R6I0_ASPWE|nr:uncharacterized protein ASPWEDRAFT_716852 [Aspergillus wentii DTO 134E9]OJJ30520.1 hypothetical protein ASPWEDRAFT_716852 [Aspergillus wentii DTO 134E9]
MLTAFLVQTTAMSRQAHGTRCSDRIGKVSTRESGCFDCVITDCRAMATPCSRRVPVGGLGVPYGTAHVCFGVMVPSLSMTSDGLLHSGRPLAIKSHLKTIVRKPSPPSVIAKHEFYLQSVEIFASSCSCFSFLLSSFFLLGWSWFGRFVLFCFLSFFFSPRISSRVFFICVQSTAPLLFFSFPLSSSSSGPSRRFFFLACKSLASLRLRYLNRNGISCANQALPLSVDRMRSCRYDQRLRRLKLKVYSTEYDRRR